MKRKIIVGRYRLGDGEVQLVLREGEGADFYVHPGDIPHPRMAIGADVDKWGDIVGSIDRESHEAVQQRLCLRYQKADAFHSDSTTVLFILNHGQFSDVCRQAGRFLADCLPAVAKAWEQWKKATRKGKKK